MDNTHDTRSIMQDYTALLAGCVQYMGSLIRKYIVSVLLITLVGGAIGFACWYSVPPYYEATMVCGYNNARFTRKNYGEMIEKLDKLAAAHAYRGLAEALQLPVSQTSLLKRFEAKNMAGSPLQEDITGNYQSMYFTVKATDRSVYTVLQPALLHYLSDGPYQREVGKIEVAKLDNRIRSMEQGIQEADSIVQAYTYSLRTGGRADSAVFSGLTILLSYKDALEEKRVSLQQKKALELSPSVMVLHGFTPADHPARGSKRIILAALAGGLFLGLVQALWREAAKKIA